MIPQADADADLSLLSSLVASISRPTPTYIRALPTFASASRSYATDSFGNPIDESAAETKKTSTGKVGGKKPTP